MFDVERSSLFATTRFDTLPVPRHRNGAESLFLNLHQKIAQGTLREGGPDTTLHGLCKSPRNLPFSSTIVLGLWPGFVTRWPARKSTFTLSLPATRSIIASFAWS